MKFDAYKDEADAALSEHFLSGDAYKIEGTDRRNVWESPERHTEGVGFPQSVASGDPTETGMMLWTRVDPDKEVGITDAAVDAHYAEWFNGSQEMNGEGFVKFEVSTYQDFSEVALAGFSPIWEDHDHVVRIDLDGTLGPGVVYYYRFITKSGLLSRTGRCRTLPESGQDLSSATIGYISCQDYTNGHFNALSHFADEDMDFFLHLGDYVYEAVGNADYQAAHKSRNIALPSGADKATTLSDYRTLYKVYRTDRNLQKLHELHAMMAVWDDHEFANDTYHPAVAPDDSFEPAPERRRHANRTWVEHMPSRVTWHPGAPSYEALSIYRSIEVGNLASLYLTDERLYRDAHPCGLKDDDRYYTEGCENMHSPKRSMLGADQRAWLLDGLKRAGSLWNLWGNQVQLTQLKFLGKYINLDAWDGFTHERKMIMQTILDEGIQNFIALSGDFHAFEASYLQEEYSWGGEKVGVELMVGSVTSSNIHEMLRRTLDDVIDFSSPLPKNAVQRIIGSKLSNMVDGKVIPTEGIFQELQNVIKIENPWIELFDGTSHGYAMLELSKEKAVWKAYTVDSIEVPGAMKSLLFEIEIPEGEVELKVKEKNSFFG